MGQAAKTWGVSDRSAANSHRRGQAERTSDIPDLNKKQRAKVLAYVKKNGANLFACQHLVSVSKQVPHPKYGDRVPYFETTNVPDPMLCPCEAAQQFRAELQGEA
jgi:hypothetical protein